jgi:HlyD family type I secretion membrane fusion protein
MRLRKGNSEMATVPPPREWFDEVPRKIRVPAVLGAAILGLSVAGFGYWSNSALLAGAVVASGAFVSTGQNKIVQHLDGGLIRAISIREGDVVSTGQNLIQLDDVNAKTELRRLILRHKRAMAIVSRLQAEVLDQDEVTFPPDLLASDDSDVLPMVKGQLITFEARRNNLKTEIASQEEGINSLKEKIAASQVQMKYSYQQIELIDDELGGKNTLLQTGLIRKSEVMALRRAQANLQGEVGRLVGDVGDAKERIARARQQIADSRNIAIKKASEELHAAEAELIDLRERIRSAEGLLSRTNIAAPVDGIVVRLRYNTAGGVIEPGKPILEIVPSKVELLIEARVRPQDIDQIKRGQEATIRLTALNRRITPFASGEVVYLSADALPDEKRMTAGGTDFYIARVKLNEDQPWIHERDFHPTPGMPAEVYIKTSERTFFEYLMKPVKDSFSRAFREL